MRIVLDGIQQREARSRDAIAIGTLHADSWRSVYRGALTDEFLDGDVVANRVELWQARLRDSPPNQLTLVAEAGDEIVAFACAYGADDERWGTLLDNLHVRRDLQGRGVGTRLLGGVAAWCLAHHPKGGLYLWVLEQNQQARRFYHGLDAADVGGDVWVPPGGGSTPRRRYAWSDLRALTSADRGPPVSGR
jgi:GNAT superfamily N-acetyltransferase